MDIRLLHEDALWGLPFYTVKPSTQNTKSMPTVPQSSVTKTKIFGGSNDTGIPNKK